MHLVDVIKHRESGMKYKIPHGDPLPNNEMYIYLERNISPDEAEKYFPKKVNPKSKSNQV